MDYSEIHSAAEEICSIVRHPPDDIGFADINRQLQRIKQAGLPIHEDPRLRVMRDRVHSCIRRLKEWPMSDSPDRAKFVAETESYIRAIALEADMLDDWEG